MPLSENEPIGRMAPPMPRVNTTLTMMMLRVWFKSTLWFTRFWIPTEAIEPNSSIMMPPSTAPGMLCSTALSLPMTEITMAVPAAMRMTDGAVMRVICMAPVTSL